MSKTPLKCEKSCGICKAYQWEVGWNEYMGADLFLFVTYSIYNCVTCVHVPVTVHWSGQCRISYV